MGGYEGSTGNLMSENNDVQHQIKTGFTPAINENQSNDELNELIKEAKQKKKTNKNKTSVTKKAGIQNLIAFQQETMQHQEEKNLRFE